MVRWARFEPRAFDNHFYKRHWYRAHKQDCTPHLTCTGCPLAEPPSWSSADQYLAESLPHFHLEEDRGSTSARFPKARCRCVRSRNQVGSLLERWCCRSDRSQWSGVAMEEKLSTSGKLKKKTKHKRRFKCSYFRPSWTCRQAVAANHEELKSGCWCRWPRQACGRQLPLQVSRCQWTERPGRHMLESKHQLAGQGDQSPVLQSDELLGKEKSI